MSIYYITSSSRQQVQERVVKLLHKLMKCKICQMILATNFVLCFAYMLLISYFNHEKCPILG